MWALAKLELRTAIGVLLLMASAMYVVFSFIPSEEVQELRRAERVFGQMSGEQTLESSGFFEAYPDGGPSDFVEFLNSDEGAKVWPQTTREYYNRPYSDDQTPTVKGRLLRPNDVDFRPYEVDPEGGKQLIYIPDDEGGAFELQVYLVPDEGPLHTTRLPFPSESRGVTLP